MDNLLTLDNVSLAYGLDVLLDKVQLNISPGERVCLIGRNGAGKSSLLKLFDNTSQPDSGSVWRKPGLRIGRLAQEFPETTSATVYEFVSEGLAGIGKLLVEYNALTKKLAGAHTDADLDRLQKLQHEIDVQNGWDFEREISTILTRLQLNGADQLNDLSGGWKRRAALARALVISPDLLLLDEPTNHLDIAAIQWLEEYLLSTKISLVFITHDRTLLRRLATRIIELDRGQLTSWPGDYDNFLQRKEEMLAAEEKQNIEFDKKLAQEEKWVRQGIKARRTRNEGRVRALIAMREERSKRRQQQGKVNLQMSAADMSGKLVVDAENITHAFTDRVLVKDFSMRIVRGDRVGLIGPNGIGKTTLLNILLGKLEPQQGKVKLGTKLEIAYFDQMRAALDPEKTVAENVTQGGDHVEVDGRKLHIVSYLNDFLFSPKRALTPVKALSGGECNRLLLARLFSRPANLLVMDEPTNDLDIETLELLEEILCKYKGTLLLVSHDRKFLDNVVTSTLVFEGDGVVQEYIGGYEDWLSQRPEKAPDKPELKTTKVAAEKKVNRKRKLTFNETRELKELPQRIEKMEAEIAELHQLTASAEFYQQSQDEIAVTMERLKTLQEELEHAYVRWDELDSL